MSSFLTLHHVAVFIQHYSAPMQSASQQSAPFRADLHSALSIVQLFLHNEGLTASLTTLQEETGQKLPCLPAEDLESLCLKLESAEWSSALPVVSTLELSADTACRLFFVYFLDCLSQRQLQTVIDLLSQKRLLYPTNDDCPEPWRSLCYDDRALGKRLDAFIQTTVHFLHDGTVTEKEWMQTLGDEASRLTRRKEVTTSLRSEIVACSRNPMDLLRAAALSLEPTATDLNALLKDGTSKVHQVPDVVRPQLTSNAERSDSAVRRPWKLRRTIDTEMRVHSLAIHPDSHSFAVGGEDGVIEFYDASSCELDMKRCGFQANDRYLSHDGKPVTCLDFGPSSIFTSGDAHGIVKVWDLTAGKCVCTCKPSASVTSSSTASLRSGSADKNLRGANPATALCVLNNRQIVAAWFSGDVCVIDLRSGATVHDFKMGSLGKPCRAITAASGLLILGQGDSVTAVSLSGFSSVWSQKLRSPDCIALYCLKESVVAVGVDYVECFATKDGELMRRSSRFAADASMFDPLTESVTLFKDDWSIVLQAASLLPDAGQPPITIDKGILRHGAVSASLCSLSTNAMARFAIIAFKGGIVSVLS